MEGLNLIVGKDVAEAVIVVAKAMAVDEEDILKYGLATGTDHDGSDLEKIQRLLGGC